MSAKGTPVVACVSTVHPARAAFAVHERAVFGERSRVLVKSMFMGESGAFM